MAAAEANKVSSPAEESDGEDTPGEELFSPGLNVDSFVKVCLQLLRDNFLVKVIRQRKIKLMTIVRVSVGRYVYIIKQFSSNIVLEAVVSVSSKS